MNKIVRWILISLMTLSFASAFAQEAAPNNKLYDFRFVNMNFNAAFQSISTMAGVDIVLAPDVSGKISNLQVTKKSWQDVLKLVCDTYDLTWTIEDKYVYVQRSTAYQEKQKRLADKAMEEERNAPLVRKNFQVEHAKADELVKVLETMKSSRGKITTVERTNSIIVYDTEKSLAQMENALEELDVETLQIMITAKLVVVSSDLARELGVDWTAKMGTTALTPGVAGTPTGSVAGASRTSVAMHSLPNNGVSPGVTNATTAISASVLDNNVQVAVASILSDASTEVLATPQISTMDNVEAQIFMGDQISIRVIDDDGESSTKMVETGIKLVVTPHVSGDNRIMLDLHPQNDSYRYDEMGQVVISKQEAETKVVVGDGETVVIGGLTRNEHQETESGIPFLMDIPVLGNLFKYTKKTVTKNDLVIFVTPRIIHNYVGKFPLSEAPKTKVVPAADAEKQVAPVAKPVQAQPQEAQAQPAAEAAPQPKEDEAAVAGDSVPAGSAEEGW
ncbi:MAG: secretin N-terminal domain-containing protein [Hallerella porci]|uniref:Type IV pilus assembly protein PilQ n=1 Tax=Hallerella porci TaxID=1945871 RepID=A0ABX5LJ27_9BACT|nr:secretin N-terminal domain-containing protein [Hallerella porci]MDY3920823.1 secretin N-terminal domain-containing protein [Hallerella porci]PWK93201.1 type IV pilus assembly protein PilQ [Hallerella porci]